MITKRFTLVGALVLASLVAAGCASNFGENKHSSWLQDEPKRNRSKDDPAEPKMLPTTLFAAGKLLESRGQYEQAAQKYQQAVAVNHAFLAAYNRLGLVLDRLGRYEAADEAFVRAIELAPDKAFLRNNLAFSYILQRRWADAEAELLNALQLQKNFPRARINLGLALARQGKFTAALKEFESTLRKDEALFNLGTVFASMGRYQDANELYRKALAANPSLSAAQAQIERLIPHLASPRPDEPRARITDTEIVDMGVARAESVPSSSAGMPADQQTAQTAAVSEQQNSEMGSQSPRDAARPAPLPAEPVASEEHTDVLPVAPVPESPAQSVSLTGNDTKSSPPSAQPSVDANMVSPSPAPQKQADSTLDHTARSQQTDGSERVDMLHFEHDIPDYAGLPPARQREILEAACAIIRAKVAHWSDGFRSRLASTVPPRSVPVQHIEHDRPDLQSVSPGTHILTAGSGQPDEADFLPSSVSVRDDAAVTQKESGED